MKMRKAVLIGLVLLFFSCAKKVKKEDLYYLNGYWEIEKVTFPDGSSKDYMVNTSIDYIEITDEKCFRKKVQPTLNGTYVTSNDAEFFTIMEKEGVFICHYKNNLSEWEEQLVSLSKSHFSLMDQDNTIYNYKKYEPINIRE